MIAVDTNVLVRLVTNDDPAQAARAAALFASDDVFISKTVVLEAAWVLRGAYGLDRRTIHAVLERLLDTASLSIETRDTVARAVAWFGSGMDLADALHLAASAGVADRFATFDRKLAKRAQKAQGSPPAQAI